MAAIDDMSETATMEDAEDIFGLLTAEEAAEESEENDIIYDVVVVIVRHGGYRLTDASRRDMRCQFNKVREGTVITILEAVPCGINNLAWDNNWDSNIRKMKEFLAAYGRSERFSHMAQGYLKSEVARDSQFMIDHADALKELEKTEKTPKVIKMIQNWKAFAAADIWQIKTFRKRYDNRMYSDTSSESPEVYTIKNVISSGIPQIPLGNIAAEINSRRDLIKYLYDNGSRNPLIIDNSCGGIDAPPPIDITPFIDFVKRTARGGRKSIRRSVRKSTRKR
jgi:hypothetical protein